MGTEKKSEVVAVELAKKQREISISEFFLKNRHLLGFDNPTRALMMVVKEAVDNSLDATTEIKILPEIKVEINQIAEDRFKVAVEDNGPGIVKQQIPNIFGKLLYGSKFHLLKQNRGSQGIGISASVMYSQLTTGKPTKIYSRIGPQKPAHYFELQIDTKKNEPMILKDEEINWNKEHGTKIELEIEGRYLKGKQGVDEYIKQTAIVNPHATFIYITPEKEKITYERATEELPKDAKEIKPHPYGIELGQLITMLKDTRANTLQGFLQSEFSRIGPQPVQEICNKTKLRTDDKPKKLDHKQVEALFKALQETKIRAPPSDCLSPIGAELLEKGLRKEIHADFYATTSRSPTVYRGMPFIIECCTGDTELMLKDGKIITIKEYVENKHFEEVLSMDKDFKINPTKVLAIHKFKNIHKILKITTRTGKNLKITSNNEIPLLENGDLIWTKAENLMAGDYIATPRLIEIYSQIPNILNLLEPEFVKIINQELIQDTILKLKEKYGSFKKTADILEINYDYFKSFNRKNYPGRPSLSLFKKMISYLDLNFDHFKNKIKKISYVDNKFTNPIPISLPNICEELMYVLGLLNSDGYISRKNISFINNDRTLHESFKRKIKELFDLNVKNYSHKKSDISNKTLYIILKKLEGVLSTLPNNLIISWLKGCADGDGCPLLRKDGKLRGINISTARYKEAKLVQTLLLRIGIISKIEIVKIPKTFGFIGLRPVKTKNIKYNIIIEDIKNAKRFSDLVGFRQVDRANKLLKALKIEFEAITRSDIIPIGNKLRSLREENGLYQYELGFSDLTIRQIEKGRQNLTRTHLQQILEKKQLDGLTYNKLRLLAFSDIFWDKIINIEEFPFEEYVYDLTTENSNFLADNIIMHNCGIAYGKAS